MARSVPTRPGWACLPQLEEGGPPVLPARSSFMASPPPSIGGGTPVFSCSVPQELDRKLKGCLNPLLDPRSAIYKKRAKERQQREVRPGPPAPSGSKQDQVLTPVPLACTPTWLIRRRSGIASLRPSGRPTRTRCSRSWEVHLTFWMGPAASAKS